MLILKYLLKLIILHLIIATPQINLYYTDTTSNNKDTNPLLHYNCLHVDASIRSANTTHSMLLYCMSELPINYHFEPNNAFSKYKFVELSQMNISSQQLYLWSAPIDIIEKYQEYLNGLLASAEIEIFYNCTLPRFGPMCQYELDYYDENHLAFHTLIHDYYDTHRYEPTDFTCYTHLQCYRGPSPSCLDWSEICDGKVDCLDGPFDEEHCWQLEINECNDDEYQCRNGQCMPRSFFRDDSDNSDCLDGSDEYRKFDEKRQTCSTHIPSLGCEDVTCINSFLTSSCVLQRKNLLLKTIYSAQDPSISEECSRAVKCMLGIENTEQLFYQTTTEKGACFKIIPRACPDMFYITNVAVFFGEVYFAHKRNDFNLFLYGKFEVPHLCYKNSYYNGYLPDYPRISFDNMTCLSDSSEQTKSFSKSSGIYEYYALIESVLFHMIAYHIPFKYSATICNRSNMYQCMNSTKCIPFNRFLDGIMDCVNNDDESMEWIKDRGLIKYLKNHFKCEKPDDYIHLSLVANGACDCSSLDEMSCDDEKHDDERPGKTVTFQNICDGSSELLPIRINETIYTDETECEPWSCINMYTRCDRIWNCPKDVDEVGCDLVSSLNCSRNHHLCVLPDTNQLMCLPTTKVRDGIVDCLGATDEPQICWNRQLHYKTQNFYCRNSKPIQCFHSGSLCDRHTACDYGDDEQFCDYEKLPAENFQICYSPYLSNASDVVKFLCKETAPRPEKRTKYFTLYGINKSIEQSDQSFKSFEISNFSIPKIMGQYQSRCHRGLDLRVWLDDQKNISLDKCLCPPSFYGNQCQYQNQRISLTLKFRALSDSWSTLFAIIVSLIDDTDKRIIHSYEQFTYLSIRDCDSRFNIYLLYSTRPKNPLNNYTIHIDIYEKISLKYRGSLLFAIKFPFLPVYRQASIIEIPREDGNIYRCHDSQCIHGKCFKYTNYPQQIRFCQCDQGWSGKYCNIQYTCNCASDSLCIGISADNRSICVCPINKFGPRCYLKNTICQVEGNSTCQNGGRCIPINENSMSHRKFHCLCPKGYIGDRCETAENKLIFSFTKDVIVSQSMLIHFIQVINNSAPIRTTTLRSIALSKDSFIVYWPQPFHLVFLEFLSKTYYMAILQNTYTKSASIVKTINSLNRCQNISELFNKTIMKLPLIRRIKYYHLPCQQNSANLSCFYDNHHMCLCYDFENHQRLSNCFEFDHYMKFDCLGQSVCENDGQCFQDTPNCPLRSICICPLCYYGIRCQFHTSGFSLSLDSILGYHITPNVSLFSQSTIIKVSVVLTTLFILIGYMNGILTFITFKNKTLQEVGCGVYLFGSSITTMLTVTFLALKFWILIITQMTSLSNRLFLQIQCKTLDFILRNCLAMDQWLNACVACERLVTVLKGAHFQKEKSKNAAKKIIIILLICIISTSIYEPIYRRIIDEENDDGKRIWCIANYSPRLQLFNSFLHTFHFFVPFAINLISAAILITKKSERQLNVQINRTFQELIKIQIREHQQLFIAPLILVILGIPRLIICFALKCMKSMNDAWLFLMAYCISFIPPMLTFVVFILPSTYYKKHFYESIAIYRMKLQRRFRSATSSIGFSSW